MRILLIGTGKLAFHLGHALAGSDLDLIGIVGRDRDRTDRLAQQIGTSSFQLNAPLPTADLILIAVSDSAIAEVSNAIGTTAATVVHTSGASPIGLLSQHEQHGVLWPIQTFGTDRPIDLKSVPLIYEGNNEAAITEIRRLAEALGDRVMELTHEDRTLLHISAVIMGNFPVFLLKKAQELLTGRSVDPSLLDELWGTMAENAIAMGPREALTGPAARGDLPTIDRHLQALRTDPDLQRTYRLLSEMIMKEMRG